jgi:ribonuclease HII
VKISPFIEMIKQGKRLKAGSFWLSTHRGSPLCQSPLPSSYMPRVMDVMRLLVTAEKAKPSPPGQSFQLAIGGKAGTGCSYKWLGKDGEGKRVAILGVRIDEQHHLSIEVGNRAVGYFHRDGDVYQVAVPPDLQASCSEILARTPAKFIGKEEVTPSTGIVEEQAFKKHACLLGADESGRGTICGSLIVACVLLTPETSLPEVFDSKDLSREERRRICDVIKKSGVPFATASITAATIDRIGITAANALAFDQTIALCEAKAGRKADLLLIDGGPLPLKTPGEKQFVTKGESVSRAIAAASIIATATHEQIMLELHQQFPQWELDKNLGYAQPGHFRNLERHGYCPEHRKSFSPIKQMVEQELARQREADQLTIL